MIPLVVLTKNGNFSALIFNEACLQRVNPDEWIGC
jgi:hypothetical protein